MVSASFGKNTNQDENSTPVIAEEDLFSEIDGFFQEYHTYDTMLMELRRIESLYPDIVRLYDLTLKSDLGHTYQGRAVWGVKVSSGVGIEMDYYDDPTKSNILLVGTHHAREWMSYEACLYTLYYLVSNYGKDNMDNDLDSLINEDLLDGIDNDGDGLLDEDPSEGRVNYLVENREIWIVPMLNPDGVEYDHTISEPGSGGGWRKNVRDNNKNEQFDPSWDGVDLNRNYPYMWWYNKETITNIDGVIKTQDSSNPRSDMYRGPSDLKNQDGDFGPAGLLPRVDEDPVDGVDNDGDGSVDEDRDGGFTEPETQALGRLIKTYDDQLDSGDIPFSTSISYHSVASLVLWPWGYTRLETPHRELFEEVGVEMASMMGYEPMQACDLYPTAGDSEDWFYGSGNILAFTIELEGAGGGFHPSPENIVSICRNALRANLYISDVSDRIEVAKQYFQPISNSVVHLESVDRPGIVGADEILIVKASMDGVEKSIPDTIKVHYSIDGHKYIEGSMLFDNDTSTYYFIIDGLEPGSQLYYYLSVKDISGLTIQSPYYGHYDPFVVEVQEERGMSALDSLMMFVMMSLIFMVVWGGFSGLTVKAIRAERSKS